MRKSSQNFSVQQLLISSAGTIDILYGFDISIEHGRGERAKTKKLISKNCFHEKIRLIDISGFTDQDNITYRLGCNLFSKRHKDHIIVFRDVAQAAAKKHNWRVFMT